MAQRLLKGAQLPIGGHAQNTHSEHQEGTVPYRQLSCSAASAICSFSEAPEGWDDVAPQLEEFANQMPNPELLPSRLGQT